MTAINAPWLSAPLRILAVSLLGAGLLIAMVIQETTARERGVEAIAAMEAVDPRSLLSGHYVIVMLQETLPEDEACPATVTSEPLLSGNREARWLALQPLATRTKVLGAASTQAGARALGPIVVRGSATCMGGAARQEAPDAPTAPVDGANLDPAVMRMELGVSRFHINQADAEAIERRMRATADASASGNERQTPVSAILSIGEDGRARLKGLIVDGERLMLNWN